VSLIASETAESTTDMMASLDHPDAARAVAAARTLTAVALLDSSAGSADRSRRITDALLARVFRGATRAPDGAEALADALASLPVETSLLLAHFDAPGARVRALAARALASPRHLRAVPALSRGARDKGEDVEVRAACVRALGAIGDVTAVPALAAVVPDAPAPLRRAVAESLAVFFGGGAARGNALEWLARDEARDVRRASLASLLAIGGPPARRAALDALTDEDAEIRSVALVILGRHGTELDGARARQFLEDPDARVRRAAASCVELLAV
jgi:HEAT repeat protein